MDEKITDTYLLCKLAESMETDFYTFGAYSDYNGMDVQNLKNPIFEK